MAELRRCDTRLADVSGVNARMHSTCRRRQGAGAAATRRRVNGRELRGRVYGRELRGRVYGRELAEPRRDDAYPRDGDMRGVRG